MVVDAGVLLRGLLNVLIFVANLAGGLVIGVALLRGLFAYLRDLVWAGGGEAPREAIRLSLGRSLALGLEFQLGADILGTALDPGPEEIGALAAIVLLRTVLNFFLDRELEAAERRAATTVTLAGSAAGALPRRSAGGAGDVDS